MLAQVSHLKRILTINHATPSETSRVALAFVGIQRNAIGIGMQWEQEKNHSLPVSYQKGQDGVGGREGHRAWGFKNIANYF